MEETYHSMFELYEDEGVFLTPPNFEHKRISEYIDDRPYKPTKNLESKIRDPIHRVLYHMLTMSIYHIKDRMKVSAYDICLLSFLLDPSTNLNLPFHMLRFFVHQVVGARLDSPICGGHFVTTLAHSYEMLHPNIIKGMRVYKPRIMSTSFLEAMKVINKESGGKLVLASNRNRNVYTGNKKMLAISCSEALHKQVKILDRKVEPMNTRAK